MRFRSVLPAVVAMAAAASVTLVPAGSAEAVNGRLGISAVTKSILKGETARVKGKVVGAGKGVTVTIQQRRGGSGREWGSGRQVTTDSKGKFRLDRKVKGKYTRDYRACIGPAGRRQCSLRARVEVLRKTTGVFVVRAPGSVTAGGQMTASGTVDAALAGRTLTFEQYDAKRLLWKPFASTAVRPDFTFDLSGTPLIPGKAQKFRVTSAAFSGRPITVSGAFVADIGGYYSLTGYAPIMGGFQPGPATYVRQSGEVVTFPVGAVLAPSAANPQAGGTVNLAGSCDRFQAQAFLDPNTAVATDRVNAVVTTATGAVVTERFRQNNIQRGDPLAQINVNITGAQTLTLQQSTPTQPADSTSDPMWFGNPIVSCAL